MKSIAAIEAMMKLELKPNDLIFVDPRAVNINELTGSGMSVPDGCMLIAVIPNQGQSVKDCIHSLPRTDAVKLLKLIAQSDERPSNAQATS